MLCHNRGVSNSKIESPCFGADSSIGHQTHEQALVHIVTRETKPDYAEGVVARFLLIQQAHLGVCFPSTQQVPADAGLLLDTTSAYRYWPPVDNNMYLSG